jgi:hypothetical protein
MAESVRRRGVGEFSSTGPFEAWDIAVAAVVVFICWSCRHEFATDRRAVNLARVALAVALMLILIGVASLIWRELPGLMDQTVIPLVDGYFVAAAALFAVLLFAYRPRATPA